MTKTVSIAMCTYNGARYIDAQLDSIIGQTRQPEELVVCDDFSTDDTVAIVESFRERASFPVRIFNNETNLQPYRNYEQALSLCRGDALFFCDQDDVWLPRKIERMLEYLIAAEEKFGADTPILLHSDLEVVDANLERVDSSFARYFNIPSMEPDLVSILFANVVTGCASAINKPLMEKMLPFPDPHLVKAQFLHDWWSAICAVATGRILFLDESLVRYRIHADNVFAKLKDESPVRNRIHTDNVAGELIDECPVRNRIHADNAAGDLQNVRDRIKLLLESARPANIYRLAKKNNMRAVAKIVSQIEKEKQSCDLLRLLGLLDSRCPQQRNICDFATLDSGPALARLPAIWRTRLRGKGTLRNLRRAIRIMVL